MWIDPITSEAFEYSYLKHRQLLDYLCGEIQSQFPETYPNTEAVFEEFVKANFNGRFLTIGRIMEQTFGKGTFRLLGTVGLKKWSVKGSLNQFRN